MIKRLALVLLSLTTATVFADTYPGNGGTGFGGAIGTGSLSLTDDGTTITGTISRGTGGFNDALVIYLDTTAGGAADTSGYTDTADYLRKAISGTNGSLRSTFVFPSSFGADFAIALAPSNNANFGGLWDLSTPGNFGFVTSVGLTPNNSTTAPTYTFTFTYANLNLASGTPFNFVVTYLDANGAYRSNESFATTLSGTVADVNGNFGQNTTTAENFSTYPAAAVPEPSTLALLAGPGLLGAWFFIRRRRP